ncbi:hypothetical protein BJX76DRAFT_360121 [Aspergillus varians]
MGLYYDIEAIKRREALDHTVHTNGQAPELGQISYGFCDNGNGNLLWRPAEVVEVMKLPLIVWVQPHPDRFLEYRRRATYADLCMYKHGQYAQIPAYGHDSDGLWMDPVGVIYYGIGTVVKAFQDVSVAVVWKPGFDFCDYV